MLTHTHFDLTYLASLLSASKSTADRPPSPPTPKVGPERYRAPECLFHPEQMGSECMGVHDCLLKGIMRTDMDMRRTLFGQVVLSGGSTLFPGFGDRLLNEVKIATAARVWAWACSSRRPLCYFIVSPVAYLW